MVVVVCVCDGGCCVFVMVVVVYVMVVVDVCDGGCLCV